MSIYQRGTLIGPFRLENPVSERGGMASVYEASVVDANTPERNGKRVALKIARQGGSNDHIFETLLRQETEMLNGLRHPGVVRIVPIEQFNRRQLVARASKLPGAPWYFAMELLSRYSMTDVIPQQRRYSLLWRVDLLYQIAIILEFLHQREIAHRDLKPENILFRTPPNPKETPSPVLIDFGLGLKRQIAPDVQAATITHASPERVYHLMQAGYRSTDVNFDHLPADIWALGVIAYELLTGYYPFGQGDPRTVLSQRILNEMPPRMQGVPLELEKLVAYMLDKRPQNRPKISQVIHMLEHKIELIAPRI